MPAENSLPDQIPAYQESHAWAGGLEQQIAEHTAALERANALIAGLSRVALHSDEFASFQDIMEIVGRELKELGMWCCISLLEKEGVDLVLRYTSIPPGIIAYYEEITARKLLDSHLSLAELRQDIALEREEVVFTTGLSIWLEQLLAGATPAMIEHMASLLHVSPDTKVFHLFLIRKQQILGLLTVWGAGICEADLPALSVYANQVAAALENVRLFMEVEQGRERLRKLAEYLQAVREEERTRIAREIHDELGQALTALKMDLVWLAKRMPDEPSFLREKMVDMASLIDHTTEATRRVLSELRPALLDNLGLGAAIEWQTEEFGERSGIEVEIYGSEEEPLLHPNLASALFRIFQETLTNVARHAQASKVVVRLQVEQEEVVLTVQDNGRGITREQVEDGESLGLLGIRERVAYWNGSVSFRGEPGRGTTVTVRVPRRRDLP